MHRSTNRTIVRMLKVLAASLLLAGGGISAVRAQDVSVPTQEVSEPAAAVTLPSADVAAPAVEASASRVPVVAPLVEAVGAGNRLGPAVVCPTVLGAVQPLLGSAPPELATPLGEGVDAANEACRDASAAVVPVLDDVVEQTAPLEPVMEPAGDAVGAVADVVEDIGTSSGDLVGGHTLIQLSETLDWLRG